jgi:FkbM family methyltransferase
MIHERRSRDLVADIGMSEGNDTDFYIRKGFCVVGIEADPLMFRKLAERFAEPIAARRLVLMNRAAYRVSGEPLAFFINREAQGHSRVVIGDAYPERQGERTQVASICWSDIVTVMGIPYYCKIDIEGLEAPFIESMLGSEFLPEYISAECHAFDAIEAMYRVGYRKFAIINQVNHRNFTAPNPPLEGTYVPNYDFVHSSGYFGKELHVSRWLDFKEAVVLFDAIQRLRASGTLTWNIWFDCHAHMPG